MSNHPGSSRSCATRGWTIFLFLWIAFIWGHSLVPGVDSSAESSRFVDLFYAVFVRLGITERTFMTFLVRKAAHFSEYAVLGFSAHALFRSLDAEKRARWLVLLTVLVPVCDETIQLFTPERSGQVTDVLLDLCGMLFGAIVFLAVTKIGKWLKNRAKR